jgi:hypothetical protein
MSPSGIDPISSYLGKVDGHHNAEVRSVLDPLSEMAERMRVAVASITHFNKPGDSKRALHRIIGSIAFVAAARIAFAVVADAEKEGRLLFLPVKNNIARRPPGLAYYLTQSLVARDVVPGGIVASSVDWCREPVDIDVDATPSLRQPTHGAFSP